MDERTLYRKLVDLYAGDELTEELKDEMEQAAMKDATLAHDMSSLRTTVEALRGAPAPVFSEEAYERVLAKIYAQGVDARPKAPASPHLQLHLPISG